MSINAKKVQDTLAKSNCVAQETFGNIHTILSFAIEDDQFQKYQDTIDENYDLQMKQVRFNETKKYFIFPFLTSL